MDNLQWFKFSPAEWMMGRIQRLPPQVQVDFIRLCCKYWQKDCQLTIDDAQLEAMDSYPLLVKHRIITEEINCISIAFLDEQKESVVRKSQSNRENGKLGGRPPRHDKKDTTYYVVRLYDDNEDFIKSGITSNSISRRMGNIPYNYEVIFEHLTTTKTAIELEHIVEARCKSYTPSKKFGGYRECFESESEVMAAVKAAIHNPTKPNDNPNQSQEEAKITREDKEKRREEQDKDKIKRIEERELNAHEREVADAPAPDDGVLEFDSEGNPINQPPEQSKEKVAPKRNVFKKPKFEEVQEYFDLKYMSKEAEAFWNYYESNGWRVGRNPMKDWKAAIKNWIKRAKEFNLKPTHNGAKKSPHDITEQEFAESLRKSREEYFNRPR